MDLAFATTICLFLAALARLVRWVVERRAEPRFTGRQEH